MSSTYKLAWECIQMLCNEPGKLIKDNCEDAMLSFRHYYLQQVTFLLHSTMVRGLILPVLVWVSPGFFIVIKCVCACNSENVCSKWL